MHDADIMTKRGFTFYGELRNETDKCWVVFDGINTILVPKSQAVVWMLNSVDAAITIPCWLAKEKGII